MLDQSTFPATLESDDSIALSYYGTSISGIPIGTAFLGDLTSVSDSTITTSGLESLSSYQFYQNRLQKFAFHSYKHKLSLSIATTSMQITNDIVEDTFFDLSTITADPTDSLFILPQTSTYSSSHQVLPFPCTYSSSWSSSWSADLNFELNLFMFSYTHTPCIKRTYTNDQRYVTGWGKMRVNDAAGNPSDYFDVLQVRSTTSTIDSFFVNGLPFPGILLTVFLLQQAQKDTTYTEYYYRVGEITPLVKVEFRDINYTQPLRATWHLQRLYKLGVPAVSSQAVGIYPNPAKGELHIQTSTPCKSCTYVLSDITGQSLQEGVIPPSGRVVLPANIPPGVYAIRASENGRVFCTRSIEVSR